MGEVAFQQITDRELVELLQRRSPHHPRRISRGELRAFLDGHLVPRDAADAATGGSILDISSLVEKMIKAGIHTVTDNGKGMTARAYKRLWPKTVIQPPEYVGRFDQALLVDTTVDLTVLIRHGNVAVYTDPATCEDMVPAPTKEDGAPLTRYVVFFQDGAKNKGRTVEDCRTSFAKDEIGLVTQEGLYLPIQHEPTLSDHAVDLPGSRYGDWHAPCVRWFGLAQPGFSVGVIRSRDPGYGSASRGSVVIAVT